MVAHRKNGWHVAEPFFFFFGPHSGLERNYFISGIYTNAAVFRIWSCVLKMERPNILRRILFESSPGNLRNKGWRVTNPMKTFIAPRKNFRSVQLGKLVFCFRLRITSIWKKNVNVPGILFHSSGIQWHSGNSLLSADDKTNGVRRRPILRLVRSTNCDYCS